MVRTAVTLTAMASAAVASVTMTSAAVAGAAAASVAVASAVVASAAVVDVGHGCRYNGGCNPYSTSARRSHLFFAERRHRRHLTEPLNRGA